MFSNERTRLLTRVNLPIKNEKTFFVSKVFFSFAAQNNDKYDMELKNRIVKEASNLFFHNGIKSITMADIATHLGISKRTLYGVFKDKEELLEECLERNLQIADREGELLLQESQNVIDAMMRVYAKHLNDMHKMNPSVIHDLRKYHPKLYHKIEEKNKNNIDIFIPLFEKGVEQGLMENDINFEVLLWLLKAQFKMLMEGDFIPTNKYPIEEFVRAIILNFTRGIATPKGDRMISEFVHKLDNKKKN